MCPHILHKSRQFRQARFGQVAQLTVVDRINQVVELCQELQAGIGNSRAHHTPVLRVSGAGDQPSPIQPIQQPRDVRVVLDQLVGDFAARGPLGAGTAQDSKDVELRQRQIVRLEQLRKPALEFFGGLDDRSKDRVLRLGLTRSCSCHTTTLFVITNIVNAPMADDLAETC